MTSSIKTVSNFDCVLQKLDSLEGKELVAFDVDQVLIDPVDHVLSGLGSDIKDRHFKDIRNRLGQGAFDYLYSIIVRDRSVVRLDDRLPFAIKDLHKRNIHTIGLTAFWDGPYGVIDDMSSFRVNQLKDFDFDFSPNKLVESHIYKNHKSPRLNRHPRLRSGVLHTSHVSKGDTLLAYLKEQAFHPSTIIFIDDQPAYLDQVEQACKKINVPFEGFCMRQSFLSQDLRNQEIDEAIAALQFQYLEKNKEWLDDRKASNMLQKAVS